MPARFLFVTWEGGGNVAPELAIARRLVARGHDAIVLADPCLEPDARAVGATFVPYRLAPHRTTRTAESEFVRDWEARTPLGAFARARDRHVFRPAHLFAREVLATAKDHRADVLAVDAMLFGALAGAEATRAPVAALLVGPNFLREHPPQGLGLSPAHSSWGRARDAALLALGDRFIWRPCSALLNRARADVGLEPVAHPLDQLRRLERVLVLGNAAFDFDAPSSEGNVRYVGAQLDEPAWVAPWASPWPNASKDPLVIVALSTTFQNQRALLARLIDALSTLAVRAIVTVGPAMDPHDFPSFPHIHVCASAPHGALFEKADLVVTHGGHGTIARALAAGVPLVCIPMGRDQHDNAARVLARGAGVKLSARSHARKLRGAIAHALADRELRANAKRAATLFAEDAKTDAAVTELEALHHA